MGKLWKQWLTLLFEAPKALQMVIAAMKLVCSELKIMASSPITSWEIDGETVETVSDFIWGGLQNLQTVTAAMKLKDAYSLEEKL